MPDDLDYDDPDTEDFENLEGARQLIRDLRSKLKNSNKENGKLRESAAEGTKALRERVFDKAGIPDSKLGQLFRDAYAGDLTDEAIKAAATEMELIKAPETSTEVAATEQMSQFANASIPASASMTAVQQAEIEKAALISPQAVERVMRQYGMSVNQ